MRRLGGPKNPAAVKKAIPGIAYTLLKISYQVLRSGKPYEDPGADFYTRRESPSSARAYLLRQLEKLSPGCTITITPAEATEPAAVVSLVGFPVGGKKSEKSTASPPPPPVHPASPYAGSVPPSFRARAALAPLRG